MTPRITINDVRAILEGITQGPWIIGNGGETHGAEFEVRTGDDADLYIVGVQWASVKDEEGYIPPYGQAAANARAIAAVPALLQAFIEMDAELMAVRESCAKIAENHSAHGLGNNEYDRGHDDAAKEIAAKIRVIIKGTDHAR